MVDPVRLFILGAGAMANTHAERFGADPRVKVVACVDTNPDHLAAFQTAWNVQRAFPSLDEALDWGQFDAVSNVTPDGVHFRTTMRCLEAGKHVLCEKPLATNAAEARKMADTADAAGLVNMINLSYRAVPSLQTAAQMVRSGALGAIRHFEASYLQSWLLQPAWGKWQEESQWLWRLSTAHGSKGVLGDIGIHILDFATYAANQTVADISCRMATFDKAPGGRIGEYVLDANDSATMHVVLACGALGTVSATRCAPGHLNDLTLRLYGEKGGIEVGWVQNKSILRACLEPNLEAGLWEDVPTEETEDNFTKFITAITEGAPATPGFARGAELQALLDRAEASANPRRGS